MLYRFVTGALLGLCVLPAWGECVQFSVKTGRFNLPLVKASFLNKSIDFVLDLGMAQGLSLEPELFNQLDSSNGVRLKEYSDLTGKKVAMRLKTSPVVGLNHFPFQTVEVSETQPWGAVLSASTEVDIPPNTIGLGLFKNKGILHYGRKEGFITWCSHEPAKEQAIEWHPLSMDEEGIHLSWTEKGRALDLVLDTASTFSILKQQKGIGPIQCPGHPHYQCHVSDEKKSQNIHESFYLMDLPKEFQADGLLGDSFFQKHDVVIDTIHQRLGLIRHAT